MSLYSFGQAYITYDGVRLPQTVEGTSINYTRGTKTRRLYKLGDDTNPVKEKVRRGSTTVTATFYYDNAITNKFFKEGDIIATVELVAIDGSFPTVTIPACSASGTVNIGMTTEGKATVEITFIKLS